MPSLHPNQQARALRQARARKHRQARNAHATTPPVPRPPAPPPLPAHCARTQGTTRTRVAPTLRPGTVLPAPQPTTPCPVPLPTVVWHYTARVWRRYAPVVDPTTGEETVRYVGMGRTLTLEAVGLCAWQPRYYRVWTTTRHGSTQYTVATSTTGEDNGVWTRCPNTPALDVAALIAWLNPRLGEARTLEAWLDLTADA